MREATLTACEFTAGGSGMASTAAMNINAPRAQIMHECSFIPACAPSIYNKTFRVLQLGELANLVAV